VYRGYRGVLGRYPLISFRTLQPCPPLFISFDGMEGGRGRTWGLED
jgi:hypothetical protein